MPRGRPKGVGNKKGHNAGGDRRSVGFVERKEDEREKRRKVEENRKAKAAERLEHEREAAQRRREEAQRRHQQRVEETSAPMNVLPLSGRKGRHVCYKATSPTTMAGMNVGLILSRILLL